MRGRILRAIKLISRSNVRRTTFLFSLQRFRNNRRASPVEMQISMKCALLLRGHPAEGSLNVSFSRKVRRLMLAGSILIGIVKARQWNSFDAAYMYRVSRDPAGSSCSRKGTPRMFTRYRDRRQLRGCIVFSPLAVWPLLT